MRRSLFGALALLASACLSSARAEEADHLLGAFRQARSALPMAAPRGWSGVSRNDPGVDLSAQFTGPSRNQGFVASCHAFAAVGLLEAAYFRRYGQRVRLSEADLFLRRNVLSRDGYESFLHYYDPAYAAPDDDFIDMGLNYAVDEENDTGGTIQFAIDHGVATSPRYQDFLRRYLRYREAETRTLRDLLWQYERLSPLERAAYNVTEHWVQLQQSTASLRIIQNYLTGGDAGLERERELMRGRFEGLRLSSAAFPSASRSTDPNQCRLIGRPQTQALIAQLRAGRPVAAAWGHVLIVTGYRVAVEGVVVFRVRNSHGPAEDHDISESETCKIRRLLSVVER